jgi:hypothetical protein
VTKPSDQPTPATGGTSVTSRETDQRDQAERARLTDAALRADRQGRDRAIRRADEQLPDKRDRLGDTPNTPQDRPL